MAEIKDIKQIEEAIWEIPTSYKKGMRVPARIVATEKLLKELDQGVAEQVTNMACLPGIVKHAMCMSDAHWGYGAPIGGVAAFDIENEGVISPGIIGFDINCGMKTLLTNLTIKDVQPKIKELVDTLFKLVPAGVGCKGFVKLNKQQFKEITENGSRWCIENGYGWEEDLERTESYGKIDWADSSKVHERAISRGINQLGTLGSGNHYLEIQYIKEEEIFDKKAATKLGISPNQIVVTVHCGSRGFGHEIATNYLKIFDSAMKKYNITVNDRELACAPFYSNEGQDYYKAMACAANMAFANRQVILHKIREGFSLVFKKTAEDLGIHSLYDVAHNVGKIEEHKVDGKKKKLLVHRKGATRAFPPGHEELAPIFRDIGQVCILGGSMETGSALLLGTKEAEKTFYTTAHGSGRVMSRTKAKQIVRGDVLQKEMLKKGIYVKSTSMSGLAEEFGGAYKNLGDVIDAVTKAKISRPLVIMHPLGNVKG
ncbi:MAG TPA: RtcB family protein [Candidatus Nanoarchaeia archaeon]|nr:RtcB family protein [Candidatus Nanoarchaeia archaeon]